MTITEVVPARLIQAVRNKLLRACCHQLVNNLLRADDITRNKFLVTNCCESVGFINLVKMITTRQPACIRLVNNWEEVVRTYLVDNLRDSYACSWFII
jgi:hypothetical protein